MSQPPAMSLSRRLPKALALTDRPTRLPHMELGDSTARFLGGEVDPAAFPSSAADLWSGCDGTRPLESWGPADRELIGRWHAAGLVVAAPSPRPASAFSLTFVSPHPDDAQLALGSTVFRFGGRVVDVFSHETWTRVPYYQDRPELASRLLIEEERVACHVLGADLTLLGHLDGANRPAWREGFLPGADAADEVRSTEPELFERITDDLDRELSDGSLVLAPLAVGGHVDHLLVREAVCELVANKSVEPERVVFYEDMPYSLFTDAVVDTGRLSERLGGPALTPVLIPGSPQSAEAKRESLWPYRLQVLETVANRIGRYGRNLMEADPTAGFAERVWVSADSARAVRELAAAACEDLSSPAE
ncbi:PIG-L deacetylase family protein [Streptomyces niveiscabiei]|uniref:PIG-L deacetylase family protein n=1 Tax=Streptomyces niveiscabiei TaxID=164115 RepID=A0ABW9I849_9ACTN